MHSGQCDMERGANDIWLSRTEQPAVRNFAIEKITEFVEEDISDISSSFLLREGDLLEGTMVSRSLQRLVQEMHATPFASLSTHEQSIYTRIEDASTSLDVHIAGMVLLSPGCFKHSHENCNPPYEICTGKSSARSEVTEEQKELWRSAFNILLTMLQYVFLKFLRISSSLHVIKPFFDVILANLSMSKSYCGTSSAYSPSFQMRFTINPFTSDSARN